MSLEAHERRDEVAPLAPSLQAADGQVAAPRLVSTVVCAYSRHELPTPWIQVFRRFERAVARAGFRVRLRLLPIDDLPESFEVLVVPPDLAEQARARQAGAHLLCTTPQQAPLAVDALLRELESGQALYAERARPDEPTIVRHRGAEVL